MVDRDQFALPVEEIASARVVQTYVSGRLAHPGLTRTRDRATDPGTQPVVPTERLNRGRVRGGPVEPGSGVDAVHTKTVMMTPAMAGGRAVGSGLAFEDFVAARSHRLLRTAYLLTRDHALAEDLLQTALAKAWRSWSRIGPEPEPYVRRILVTTYSSWWRRRWNGEQPIDRLPEQPSPAVDVDARSDLWEAVGRLPRRMRAVVVLRFYEDLSERETADLLGIAPGTVKSQTSKALAHLRIDPAVVMDAGGQGGAA